MADISKIVIPGGESYDLKDAEARESLSGLPIKAGTGTGAVVIGKEAASLAAGDYAVFDV